MSQLPKGTPGPPPAPSTNQRQLRQEARLWSAVARRTYSSGRQKRGPALESRPLV